MTKTQFQAVLAKSKVAPSANQRYIQILVDAFSFGEDRDKCNYQKFCDEVEWDMHRANGLSR